MELTEKVSFEVVVRSLGLDPVKIPPGEMGLVKAHQYRDLSERASIFSKNPDNEVCLAYRVEREFDHAGIILRNLYQRPRAQHLMVLDQGVEEGPYFHNFTAALPLIWKTSAVVACEGAKDARVLYQLGLPGVAYLGAVPSREWLRVLYRYCRLLLWCPDNDVEYNTRVQWVREKQIKVAKEIGFRVRVIKTATKDPGDLVHHEAEATRTQRLFWEAVRMTQKRSILQDV